MTSDELDQYFNNLSGLFRRTLEAECDSHSSLTLDVKTEIRNNETNARVSFRFDAHSRCIWFEDAYGTGVLTLQESEDGRVKFANNRTGAVLLADEAATDFATRLLAPAETT